MAADSTMDTESPPGLVTGRPDAGVAFIAGGSGALGRAIALQLAHEGSDIAFTYRRNEAAAIRLARDVTALGRRVSFAAVTLEDAASVAGFVARVRVELGAIQSVIYSSGPSLRLEAIADIEPSRWAEVMNADINGCFNLVQQTLPSVRECRGAYVAIITAAVDRYPARDALSAVPKAAIELLIRGLAKEEGRHGVRANCVAPGWIDAGVGQHMLQHELSADAAARVVKSIPLRRLGTPEDVASITRFLLSSAAGYISGQTIAVDGGMQV
jgi:NAD(P)-dependent dehydrogenase (short-subunit alcohol dehydrogenase family)